VHKNHHIQRRGRAGSNHIDVERFAGVNYV